MQVGVIDNEMKTERNVFRYEMETGWADCSGRQW